MKPAEYLLYFFISNLKFYFFLKFETTTILTQGVQGSQGLEVTELSPCDYKYNIEHHSVIYTEDALNYINGVEDQQQTDSHPVATDSPQQLRLNDLKEYIGLLETQAAAKKIPFDALDLPLTKKRLLEELQARYNTFKRIKNDQFEKDWKIAKDEGICANQRATEAKGKTFLKSIYG